MTTSEKGKVPKIVALEVLEKNGVNIDRLKELITKGVGAEFTTYYYYTILRMHCTGLEGEGIILRRWFLDCMNWEGPYLGTLGNSQIRQDALTLIYQIIGKTLTPS